MEQMSFKVKKEIIRKDELRKWEKLYKKLKMLHNMFESGKIVNNIDNGALIGKILRIMDKLEEGEDI